MAYYPQRVSNSFRHTAIPDIGRFSGITQYRVHKLVVILFCKPIVIKLVFCTFSLIGSVRALCINLPVQVVMRVISVKQTDIFLHAYTSTYHQRDLSESCRAYCSAVCFNVLYFAATRYRVKLNESIYIKWEKPNLNQQVKHVNLTLSLKVP